MFKIRDWLVVYEDGSIVTFEARTKSSAIDQANQIIGNHGSIQEIYKRVK